MKNPTPSVIEFKVKILIRRAGILAPEFERIVGLGK
jgi:hypothetical protein